VILAMPGQVEVFVKTGATGVESLFGSLGGKTIAQIPMFGYYLVGVPEGGESAFMSAVATDSRILAASPNIILGEAGGTIVDIEPQLDPNGSPSTHARDVQAAATQCLGQTASGSADVKLQDTELFSLAWGQVPILPSDSALSYEIRAALAKAIQDNTTPVVLNVSMALEGGIVRNPLVGGGLGFGPNGYTAFSHRGNLTGDASGYTGIGRWTGSVQGGTVPLEGSWQISGRGDPPVDGGTPSWCSP